jgi:hypothetical protein
MLALVALLAAVTQWLLWPQSFLAGATAMRSAPARGSASNG